MEAITAQLMAKSFGELEKETLLCPDCYHILQQDDQKNIYCPNEMCLNDEQYDKYGNSFS